MMKQFFAPLFEPLGALWLLMALGVAWLAWRRQWRCAAWLGGPVVLIFLLGSTPLVDWLVAVEERQWAVGPSDRQTVGPSDRQTVGPADAVVALGGGHQASRFDPLGFSLGEAEDRVLAAVEMVRAGRAQTLVLGGSWAVPGDWNEGTGSITRTRTMEKEVASMGLIQDWLVAWGVAGAGVTNLGLCRNTHDEALQFRKLAEARGWKRVLLVTSALHMRRSLATFKKQGVDAEPVACDFQEYGVFQGPGFSPFPRQGRFDILGRYLHEKIGWWAYRARGWTGREL